MEHTKIKWEPYYRSNTCVQSLFQMCANLEIVCIQSKIVSNFGKLNKARLQKSFYSDYHLSFCCLMLTFEQIEVKID